MVGKRDVVGEESDQVQQLLALPASFGCGTEPHPVKLLLPWTPAGPYLPYSTAEEVLDFVSAAPDRERRAIEHQHHKQQQQQQQQQLQSAPPQQQEQQPGQLGSPSISLRLTPSPIGTNTGES